VGAGKQAFAPARDEAALAVEHDHRMGAAVEHVDAVLAVDRDGGDVAELPLLGQLRPVFDDAVTVFARAENGRHIVSPYESSFRGAHQREPGISRQNFWIPGSTLTRRPRNDDDFST
jgi:hypothetical protein